jgi:hypothetical protein
MVEALESKEGLGTRDNNDPKLTFPSFVCGSITPLPASTTQRLELERGKR